jgi:plasmid stability protein
MVDILVRNVEEDVARLMKDMAATEGTSLNEMARKAFRALVQPSREQLFAEADRLRAKIGRVSGDSTALIREDRDNNEPYR